MAVKKNTLLIVAGSLLILLLIGVTILLISEKQTNKELVMEFNLDKEDLENQYTDFARQYDELKLTVSNDSLSVLLEQEQLKTQRLLEELRTVKSSNATEIRRLKKELASLRKVMIGYINQIDSLNRLTAQQKEIIADVTKKYNAASRQISRMVTPINNKIRRLPATMRSVFFLTAIFDND
jgi:predicted  nucleic acid-binding Zn-ribbon protein